MVLAAVLVRRPCFVAFKKQDNTNATDGPGETTINKVAAMKLANRTVSKGVSISKVGFWLSVMRTSRLKDKLAYANAH